MGGDRQKAGVDDDGDGVPNKADEDPKDGNVKEDMDQKEKVNESKTPQPKPEQTNEDWYWGSLYSKLKDKWAK